VLHLRVGEHLVDRVDRPGGNEIQAALGRVASAAFSSAFSAARFFARPGWSANSARARRSVRPIASQSRFHIPSPDAPTLM
jgi:hypothetical protein